MSNDNLLDYYIKHAIITARQLSIDVRKSNGVPLNPKNGADFKMLPVYENEGTSLLKLTQNICETEIICVSTPPEFVDAYWKKYANRSVVTITDQQNYCRTRYFVCKELMHNYLHDNGSATTDNTALRDLILELVKGGQGSSSNAPRVVDMAAYYGALEYLIPSDTMPLARAIFNEIAQKDGIEKAYHMIALSLRIPLALVEYRFANDDEFNVQPGE